MHQAIEPAIHYWGTPVILVSTLNPNGSANVAPMSSAWWLGWSCMLGFDASSQTVENLRRERECVLNLASSETAEAVNRLARTTGSRSVPLHKRLLGYRHLADKAGAAGVTLAPGTALRTPRVMECQVHLECELVSLRPFGKADARLAIPACAAELQIRKAHAHPDILAGEDRIDVEQWRPLLMSFRHLFVRGPATGSSRLAVGDEALYAPWKKGRLHAATGKALGALAQARYGIKPTAENDGD